MSFTLEQMRKEFVVRHYNLVNGWLQLDDDRKQQIYSEYKKRIDKLQALIDLIDRIRRLQSYD